MSHGDVSRRLTSSLKLLIQAGARAAQSLSDRPAPGDPYVQRHHELDLQALADLRFALALFEEIEIKADLGLPLPSQEASAAVAAEPGVLAREVSRAADQYAFIPLDVFGHRALVVNTSICHEQVAEVLLRGETDLVITYFFSGLKGLCVQLFANGKAHAGSIARRFGGSGTADYGVLPPLDSEFNVLGDLERAAPPPGLWADWAAGAGSEDDKTTRPPLTHEERVKATVDFFIPFLFGSDEVADPPDWPDRCPDCKEPTPPAPNTTDREVKYCSQCGRRLN